MRSLTTYLLLLLAVAAHAQNDRRNNNNNWNRNRQGTLGGGLEIGIPLGAFADSWGREIVGLSANLSIPMRRLPLETGFDFAWGNMGGTRRNIDLLDADQTIVKADLNVRSNVYGYHGFIRFKPFNGPISPYFDLMAGIRHFSTRTTLSTKGQSEPLEKERKASDFTGSSGWAAGVMVAPKNRPFYIEARLERLNGGRVTYVDPRTITIAPSGEVSFGTLTSPTRNANVQLGVGMRF